MYSEYNVSEVANIAIFPAHRKIQLKVCNTSKVMSGGSFLVTGVFKVQIEMRRSMRLMLIRGSRCTVGVFGLGIWRKGA